MNIQTCLTPTWCPITVFHRRKLPLSKRETIAGSTCSSFTIPERSSQMRLPGSAFKKTNDHFAGSRTCQGTSRKTSGKNGWKCHPLIYTLKNQVGTPKWTFGKWLSLSIGWFLGSIIILRGVLALEMPVQVPKKSEWMMDNSTITMVFGDTECNDHETKHVEH